MKQSITAVEWYAKQMQLKDYYTQEDFDKIFNQAKEMENEQQSHSDQEVIEFAKWLLKFDNLKNENEYVIKQLYQQFKNEPVQEKMSLNKKITYAICISGAIYLIGRFMIGIIFNV
jgi:hypothetical protein